MNERYIFRGKRADNGEWVVGYYIEAEKLDKTGVEKLIKIADFFDVSADTLLEREQKPVKVDLLTALNALLADYGFDWDGANRCFRPAGGNVYALVGEYMQLRELVKGGQLKADVLELWLEDKRKKMEAER